MQSHGVILWWPRRYGMASLLRYTSYIGHFLTHSIIDQKLFFLIMLESEAPLSRFLEEVLYKYLNSFIHSGYLYSAPSSNLLRGALSPATAKENE